jgi:hypothetical protein
MEQCNILFTKDDFNDTTGCLKEVGHYDHHVCMTDKRTLMAWEDDNACECGCIVGDDYSEVCGTYWEVDNIEE